MPYATVYTSTFSSYVSGIYSAIYHVYFFLSETQWQKLPKNNLNIFTHGWSVTHQKQWQTGVSGWIASGACLHQVYIHFLSDTRGIGHYLFYEPGWQKKDWGEHNMMNEYASMMEDSKDKD
jgi:hypothetical protein